MKHIFKFFQIVLLICGVFVAEADEVKTVMEGESVTLNTGLTETKEIDLIQWGFGESGSTIAQINEQEISYLNPSHTDIFKGKLQLDQTGSLTIKNMRIKHSGLYKVQIDLNSGPLRPLRFNVTVFESPSVVHAGEAEMKSVSVREKYPVTLQTDVNETHGDELIMWRFERKLIAKHDIEAKSSPLLDTDERFRDRLKLDHQTGSLTITHTTHTDSGEYTLKINSNKQTLFKRFIVTVNAGPSRGDIVGIVFAVLAAVAVAAGVAFVIYNRSRIPERQKQINSMEPKSVECWEGRCAVLQSDHDLKRGDQMLWTHVSSVKESAIASITETDKKKTYWYDERFRGRFQLHPWTGSLIIRNLRKTDTGVYVLEIKNRGVTIYRRKYEVILSGEVRTIETVSVKEGDDVTLECSVDGSDINWMFTDSGQLKKLIDNESECPDGRFSGRLQLDKQTGSLTIKNIRTEHTGLYAVRLGPVSNPRSSKLFRVVFDDFTETSENESVITGFLGRILRFCGQARIEGVFGDEKDEMKTLSVMEGGDLKLNTETEIETDDEIILRFADFSENRPYITIARFSKHDFKGDDFKSEESGCKDRLQWNLTGPLTITITDFRYIDCGDYNVQITNKKKKSFKSFTFIVVSIDDVNTVFFMKGESITLGYPFTDLHEDDQLLWTFGPYDMIIADTNTTICDERFRGRVTLDKETKSLTIRESTKADSGEYNLQIISRNRVKHRRFDVIVFDDLKSVRVKTGESITLESPITDLHEEDQILWTFGFHSTIIDDTNNTRCDERFRGRVTLDKETGSLTISKITTEDAGEYKLQIIGRNRVEHKRFDVIIESSKATSKDEPEPVYANDTPINQKQPDSTGNRRNDSTVEMPPVNEEDLDGENKQEGMRLLKV